MKTPVWWGYLLLKVRANLSSEASRNYPSYLWWRIEPVMLICVLYLVFGLMLRRGDENFIYYLSVGVCFWAWFSSITSHSVLLQEQCDGHCLHHYIFGRGGLACLPGNPSLRQALPRVDAPVSEHRKLISLQAGFDMHLGGGTKALLSGMLLGISRERVVAAYEEYLCRPVAG